MLELKERQVKSASTTALAKLKADTETNSKITSLLKSYRIDPITSTANSQGTFMTGVEDIHEEDVDASEATPSLKTEQSEIMQKPQTESQKPFSIDFVERNKKTIKSFLTQEEKERLESLLQQEEEVDKLDSGLEVYAEMSSLLKEVDDKLIEIKESWYD